jgi:WD40-like Beta Propeller Repeat
VRDREPAISPDGRWVVFASERNPPGLYEFDRQTKQTRWLARGRRPAFSPDGKWLLLARADDRSDPGWAGKGVWQVMPARAGKLRTLGGSLTVVQGAVWSSDSAAVYLQAEMVGVAKAGMVWRQELNGGAPTPWVRLREGWELCALGNTGAAYFRWSRGAKSLHAGVWPGTARMDMVELSTESEGGEFGGLVTGCATAGAAAFVQLVPELAQRFELPMDWPQGRALGEPRAVAAPEGWRHHFSASADGRVRTYATEGGPMRLGLRAEEAGHPIWSLALAGMGVVSKRGQAFWFTGELAVGARTAWALKDHPESVRLHTNEGMLWDVAFDGSFALAYRTRSRPAEIAWLSKEGDIGTVLAHPQWNLYRAALSWDQRWVAFTAVKEDGKVWMYAAPFRGKEPIPLREWVELGRGGSQIWSPDGNRILFLSRRDGHSCLYQQPLDPVSKRPRGEAEVVTHFHGRDTVENLPEDTFRMSATKDGLIFSLGRREDRVVRLR